MWCLHVEWTCTRLGAAACSGYRLHDDSYAVKRRKLVIVQRLVRLAFMLLGVLQSGQGLQSAAARALNKVQGDKMEPADAKAVPFNIVRPLGFSPVMAMAQVSGVLGRWSSPL